MSLTLLSFIFNALEPLMDEFEGVVTEEVELRSIGSTAGMPTKVNRSDNMADLRRTSNGLSQHNEGERLTSSNQGFKFSSIKISKP